MNNDNPESTRDEKGRFTIGNNDWQNRKKIGRPKNIESPERLWELACDYFTYCDENPIYTLDFRGKDATKVHFPHPMPYTWDGLDDYLFKNEIIVALDDYKANRNDSYTVFSNIITRIDKIMRNQKFSGAAVGIFKENIIARDLGMADKTNNQLSGDKENPIEVNFPAFKWADR